MGLSAATTSIALPAAARGVLNSLLLFRLRETTLNEIMA
jgi:hypothetical protein